MLKIGEKLNTALGQVEIARFLGKGKSGYSYLIYQNGRALILKKMHTEPCPYYQFSTDDKTGLEVDAYKRLSQMNLPVPELYCYDYDQQYIIKEYITGTSAALGVSEQKITDDLIEQLFIMADVAQNNDYNLDYFPTNFIIHKGRLWYIDYELNPYDAKWNLVNWGLYYWANSGGFRLYLIEHDDSYINSQSGAGKPIKQPFQQTIQHWKHKYSHE